MPDWLLLATLTLITRRGFLLNKREKKRSEASMLAGMVLSQHASHLAIMLRDWSVLFLCRDQLRKEAYLHRVQDILDQTYCWTKPLDHAMTRGDLRLSGAPPSAILLRQFPRRMELCYDEDSKNDKRLWNVRWEAMFDCMCEGLHTFEKEIQEWVNVYDGNYERMLENHDRTFPHLGSPRATWAEVQHQLPLDLT